MRKLLKVTCSYQRRYLNKGLLMWRHRMEPVQIKAGEFVNVVEEYDDSFLCEYKDVIVRIPKGNFASVRTKAPVRSREREQVAA